MTTIAPKPKVDQLTDVVLVPMGSCEKHGPHIPLGTDSYLTIEAVERAAKLSDVPHAPLVPIGFSPHHMGEPGWGAAGVAAEPPASQA